MSDVSVIIVNFNGGDLLGQCVHSVLQSTVSVQVLVSDNGSCDGSVDQMIQIAGDDSRLSISRNNANLGFAKANNRVMPMAKGEYFLILNPDCLIKPDTLDHMLKQMALHPEAGMAGCLIRNADGTEQAGCRRRVPTPVRSLIRVLHLDTPFPFLKDKGIVPHEETLPDQPVAVEAISGAFMLVRREALEEVGLLDEGYFLHCEDLDWCMRFRMKGWKILFVPSIEVMHAKGECSKGRAVRVEWHKHCGMVRFYRKFFRHQYPLLLMVLVIAAVWMRFIALSVVLTARRCLP